MLSVGSWVLRFYSHRPGTDRIVSLEMYVSEEVWRLFWASVDNKETQTTDIIENKVQWSRSDRAILAIWVELRNISEEVQLSQSRSFVDDQPAKLVNSCDQNYGPDPNTEVEKWGVRMVVKRVMIHHYVNMSPSSYSRTHTRQSNSPDVPTPNSLQPTV